MEYIIKDKEVKIVFDGEYYVGQYDCIIIKKLFKQEVIKWFEDKFDKEVRL